MSVNLDGEHLRQQLIELINQSKIPIGMAYYILKDVFNLMEKTYYGTLNSEGADNPPEDLVFSTESQTKEKEEE